MDYYFITGSSRGIGRALVNKALERPDARVTGFARSAGEQHPHYTHLPIDLSDVTALAERADSLFPTVKAPQRLVLINNAGTLGEVKYLGDLRNASIATLFNLNVTAPTLLMNAFMRQYRTVPAKKIIINVSSGAGKYPVDGWAGYCASKAALDMVSQVAALESERRADGFYVYALAPGVVDTAMQEHIRTADAADFSKLPKFMDYKAEDALDDPTVTAEKFFQLIDYPERFEEVIQDVRNFS
ncbi:MAG: SDR family NAD(P)-dependent oxidoreductase [Tunicatimonas sp.]